MGGDLAKCSGDRYRVIERIGAGGTVVVWLAEDQHDGSLWAAKEVRLRLTPDWKTWELFERGARVLERLDHPGVPRFRELLRDEDEDDPRLWLIEEYIAGQDLRHVVEERGALPFAEACRIARAVLSILHYLHGCIPPVIHRDVKPSNIILRLDRTVALVDFGAVQEVLRPHTMGGSTVIGTYGFMPPEQFMGKAEPASDLYGVGATLVFLLTGTSPGDLEVRDMRLQYWPAVNEACGPRGAALRPVLDRLMDPRIEKRYPLAIEAARAFAPFFSARTPMHALAPEERSEIHQALAALIASSPSGAPPPEPKPGPDGTPAPAEPPVGAQAGRGLTCPGCAATMREVVRGAESTEIDICPDCHGTWLDLGELAELVPRPLLHRANLAEVREQVKALEKMPDVMRYRACPICEQAMHRRNFGRVSGVIIDECGRHGIYLDTGELEAIQEFVRLGGLEITENLQRQELDEQRRTKEQKRRDEHQAPLAPRRSHAAQADLVGTLFAIRDMFES